MEILDNEVAETSSSSFLGYLFPMIPETGKRQTPYEIFYQDMKTPIH